MTDDTGYELRLERDDDELTIPGAQISDPRTIQEPTAKGDWRVTVPHSPGLEDWAGAEAYLYADGGLLMRGELLTVSSPDGAAETTLNGPDTLKRLERGGAIFEPDQDPIEGWRAIRQYYEDHLDEWDWTVIEPDVETIDEGLVVQEATGTDLTDIVDLADTDPFVVEDGALKLTQTCFTTEGEDYDADSGSTFFGDDPALSDNSAVGLETHGDWVEWEFENEHTIPEDEVSAQVRDAGWDGDTSGVNRPLGCRVKLDGHTIDEWDADEFGIVLNWTDLAQSPYRGDGWEHGDLEPGTHTLRVEVIDDSDGDPYIVDVVAPNDSRFENNFDNTVHEDGGYLDGPELFPDRAAALSEAVEQSFNVAAARLSVSLDETSCDQRLDVSNDDGESWYPDDGDDPGAGADTESIDVMFDETVGTAIKGRATLARTDDGAQDATPRFGYDTQRLSEWSLSIDTDDRSIIVGGVYSGSHFANLQDLHEDAGMIFVAEFDEDSLPIYSLVPGAETREADWTRLDHTREVNIERYANKLRGWGAEDEDGERIEVVAESTSAIDDRGEVEGPPIDEDDVENRERLRSLVRRELADRLAQDALAGSVEIVPKQVTPGFAYEVPALDGEELTLWACEVPDGPGATGTLDFSEPDDLAAALAGVQTAIRRTR